MRRRIALLAAGLAALLLSACAPTANDALAPELSRARAAGLPMLVYAFGVPGQIQVGVQTAVPVYVQFVVTAGEPLKNVRFFLAGYSPRGIPVLGHMGTHLEVELLGRGPFSPRINYEVNSFHSRPAGFPGGDVACVELRGIEVTYANGRRREFGPRSLDPLLVAPLRRECGDTGPEVNSMIVGGPP